MADCCKHKKDPRSEEDIKKIVNRLNRIEGQIGGIRKMVEDNRYCPEIITQVSAVQSSLNSLTKEIMATHIKSCVVDDIKAGKIEAVDELCELLKKTMK
ncbi:MAG: metal-sensing transcriptional repressor [Saccharofermentans sp.]|nr:metal-sensing transcriptional repressor [Saccharofermentans sp.]